MASGKVVSESRDRRSSGRYLAICFIFLWTRGRIKAQKVSVMGPPSRSTRTAPIWRTSSKTVLSYPWFHSRSKMIILSPACIFCIRPYHILLETSMDIHGSPVPAPSTRRREKPPRRPAHKNDRGGCIGSTFPRRQPGAAGHSRHTGPTPGPGPGQRPVRPYVRFFYRAGRYPGPFRPPARPCRAVSGALLPAGQGVELPSGQEAAPHRLKKSWISSSRSTAS